MSLSLRVLRQLASGSRITSCRLLVGGDFDVGYGFGEIMGLMSSGFGRRLQCFGYSSAGNGRGMDAEGVGHERGEGHGEGVGGLQGRGQGAAKGRVQVSRTPGIGQAKGTGYGARQPVRGTGNLQTPGIRIGLGTGQGKRVGEGVGEGIGTGVDMGRSRGVDTGVGMGRGKGVDLGQAKEVKIGADQKQGKGMEKEKDRGQGQKNYGIQARQVKLVDLSGKMVGVVTVEEALGAVDEKTQDLVRITNEEVPVVRVMSKKAQFDKGRRKRAVSGVSLSVSAPGDGVSEDVGFPETTSAKTPTKKAKSKDVKQLKIGTSIADHDLQLKLAKAREFLSRGHGVRVFIERRRGKSGGDGDGTVDGVAHAVSSGLKCQSQGSTGDSGSTGPSQRHPGSKGTVVQGSKGPPGVQLFFAPYK